MKAEINKFGEEIAQIFTELSDIEKTIQERLQRHTELSSKLAESFNGIKVALDKKFSLPTCETVTVATTEAEEAARRKRFRNLGDGVVLSGPVGDGSKAQPKIVDADGFWIPVNLPPRITLQKKPNGYRFASLTPNSSFTFALQKGYRLLSAGEEYKRGDEFIAQQGEQWTKYDGVTTYVTPTTYPMKRKI